MSDRDRKARCAVAAQAAPGTLEDLVFVQKSKEEEGLILGALQENPLFENLVSELGDLGLGAFSDLTSALIGTMTRQEVVDGTVIVNEGDLAGDKFYVISKGSCGVYQKQKTGESKQVQVLGSGRGFGELALLYSCPRNATIKALSDGALWVLEQSVYNTLKRTHAEKLLKDKMALVDSVPSFKLITGVHRAQLADALEAMTFEEGEFIVREGEIGDRFYIVQQGEVCVENEGTELVRLVSGAFFGERALINDDVRQADVRVVSTTVTCLSLNRAAFLDLLGPLEQAWHWDSLRHLPLLSVITDKQVTELCANLSTQEYQEGEYIFRAGDAATSMYILDSGCLVCLEAGGAETVRYDVKGTCFGELSLLRVDRQDVPRALSVKALKKSKVLELSKRALELTVGDLDSLSQTWREDTLRRVPLLSRLSKDQRALLARNMQVRVHNDEDYIITQGHEGTDFYILERGQVEVRDGTNVIGTLSQGQFFGELALLKNEVRAMSIVAKGTASVLVVGRDVFEEQLGTLQHIMDEQVESYDSVGQKIRVNSFADLQIKAVLGMGAFGKVMLVSYKKQHYALKCFMKQQILAFGLQNHVMQERNIMMDCNSPFLVNLVGTFQEPDTLYMIMETVMGGELFTYLQNCPNMCVPEGSARFYAACTVQAFEYLHDRNYTHRDLKPENLLIDSDGYIKLADFGFAKRLKASQKTFTTCGTPDYMAPELLTQSGHTGAVDWWALGVLIYEMSTGTTPFYAEDEIDRYKLIQRGKMHFPSFISTQCKDIVKKLCNSNPSKRLGMLKGGPRDVKKHLWFKTIDWPGMAERNQPAPYVPQISNEDDTSCFDQYDIDIEHPGEPHAGPVRLPSMGVFKNF
mmetsp:Transcript_19844/g.23817  ORF Transcript_19844/g.23817 Transcript_19844/m.23817 type:complete len:864 (+) Transcript_19844:206-2797(+)